MTADDGLLGGVTVRVLQSFPVPTHTTNPYVTQLAECLEATPDVELVHFSWRSALTSSYKVFHVHWPEAVIRDARLSRAVVRHALFVGLLVRLRVARTPVVRTLHNLRPHEDTSFFTQRLLLRILDRLTVATDQPKRSYARTEGGPEHRDPARSLRDVVLAVPDQSLHTRSHRQFRNDQKVQGSAAAHRGLPYARRPRLSPDRSRRGS